MARRFNSERENDVKVILDTNMLLLLAEGIRVLEDIESLLEKKVSFLCPNSVIKELKVTVEKRSKGWRRARWVLNLLNKICIEVPSISDKADEDILLLTESIRQESKEVIVATNDRMLRSKLKMKGIPTIYLLESEMMLDTDYEP